MKLDTILYNYCQNGYKDASSGLSVYDIAEDDIADYVLDDTETFPGPYDGYHTFCTETYHNENGVMICLKNQTLDDRMYAPIPGYVKVEKLHLAEQYRSTLECVAQLLRDDGTYDLYYFEFKHEDVGMCLYYGRLELFDGCKNVVWTNPNENSKIESEYGISSTSIPLSAKIDGQFYGFRLLMMSNSLNKSKSVFIRQSILNVTKFRRAFKREHPTVTNYSIVMGGEWSVTSTLSICVIDKDNQVTYIYNKHNTPVMFFGIYYVQGMANDRYSITSYTFNESSFNSYCPWVYPKPYDVKVLWEPANEFKK